MGEAFEQSGRRRLWRLGEIRYGQDAAEKVELRSNLDLELQLVLARLGNRISGHSVCAVARLFGLEARIAALDGNLGVEHGSIIGVAIEEQRQASVFQYPDQLEILGSGDDARALNRDRRRSVVTMPLARRVAWPSSRRCRERYEMNAEHDGH